MKHSAIRSSLFAATTFAVVTGAGLAAAHAQVACGDTISDKVAMTIDLACGTDPGFTIAAKGKVDMAGHSLTACGGCTGVAFTGQGGKLSNGSISGSGPGSIGVEIGGGGVHQLENVAVIGTEGGFDITSDGCKMKNLSATNVSEYGFRSTGDKTSISRSHASGGAGAEGFVITADNCFLNENTTANVGDAGFLVSGTANKLTRNSSVSSIACITVLGNSNKLTQNTATGCSANGIEVIGDNNKVSKSVAADNGDDGLVITGANNKLTKNTASDNGSNGLRIAGNGNNVGAGNTSNNANAGILIGNGSDNGLKSNVSMGNGQNAVLVALGATGNEMSKTVGLGSGVTDLQDDNANCGGNVWAKSIFGTSDAGGMASHICIE